MDEAQTHNPLAITGYRALSQAEIDLMNEIKAHAEATRWLVDKIRTHAGTQWVAAQPAADGGREFARLAAADPHEWVSMAKQHLQQGYMALTRAIAQPSTF